MRYYVIVRGSDEGPWIVAETPDDAIAEELASTFVDGVAMAQGEAALDPDFAQAVERWQADDDAIWRRMRDEADAYDVIEEVWEEFNGNVAADE